MYLGTCKNGYSWMKLLNFGESGFRKMGQNGGARLSHLFKNNLFLFG